MVIPSAPVEASPNNFRRTLGEERSVIIAFPATLSLPHSAPGAPILLRRSFKVRRCLSSKHLNPQRNQVWTVRCLCKRPQVCPM